MHWQAVYVKPRTEKKVLERLEKNYTVFCPIRTEKRKWSDRVKEVAIPLIPGYLFFQGTESDRLGVLQDSQVVRSVFWNGKPAIIRQEEIAAIKSLVEEYAAIEIQPITAGEQVKIISGSFSEKLGKVIHISGNTARLEIQSLGIAVIAKVQAHNIKRV